MSQRATLEWRDGAIPVSTRFDDPYFSIANGLAETRHVFLDGNELPDRCVPGFHVAELGFGTGLNMLAMVLALRETNIPIRFTSFEAFPMSGEDIAHALEAFPEARSVADPFLDVWDQGVRFFTVGPVTVEVIEGDARETLAKWPGEADAWFLDGFSPAKNPELWSPEMMAEVWRHTASDGTAATYTAAGFVRRGLADAGFAVERRPGYGHKRHMTVARKGV
ncbi:tRNA (5-methylaminomethyl-2-thiouridine)(34)-methyltransferase MnmD [uncultured Maritimibacter sp.]|uniref:tRNA (5-methylaminomethyl-2-thiouridine)(34)-methyltransferase MnmD n=1 Tax=uncultured Maritimibacter sp. TaxID=991866 RepID=UPI0025993291|nr:tRNA (5-methylaminomethyl-2-thiouridine)(34)-methyltransferase MnmD [uncultured Maritimibacter sp.]